MKSSETPKPTPLPNKTGLKRLGFVIGPILLAALLWSASPPSGTLSLDTPVVTWTGGPFLISNPLNCTTLPQTCDFFQLTVVPPPAGQDYVVTVRVTAANATDEAPPTDDVDLFVRDPNGNTIAFSGTPGSVEELALRNPPAGTYTVVVQPFLVVPGGTYTGVAELALAPHTELSNCYRGALYTPDFVGIPESRPARCASLTPELKVGFHYVGRQAAEPTIGVNANNTAFYAAATFDFPSPDFPRRLARTVVLRSRDKGQTWEPVAAFRLSAESLDEPPFTLDPYVHVDPNAGNVDPVTGRKMGRVFSIDLNLVCGANTVFSDDEGETWTSRPLFGCAEPVNDHHTVATPPPPPGFTTVGYPNMVYFCFNRVSDSSCTRSHDGGLTFVPTGAPAFTGTDPDSGSICGGLHGHLAADSAGRIFLPKGHCGLPWVAISEDAGTTWQRVRIAGHTPMEDHEVSLAVDTADNIYAVWQGSFRLPYLSVSTDHGQTWSTPVMIAPPGVHEVNFPTIVAGDPGRIAVLFPGSESTDFEDPTRSWNIYVVVSTNALDANPIFTWTIANPRNDPVHRGNCGPGRCDAQDGGSMFDFLDIQVSPADGAFWGTASDTCVPDPDPAKNCVTNPQAQKLRPGQGVAIRQMKGPLLFLRR